MVSYKLDMSNKLNDILIFAMILATNEKNDIRD
jgi:hypothetical protein